MNAHMQEHRDYGFAIGVLTGTCVGAALAMWLAPRSGRELRQRVTDSARRLATQASDRYEQASTQVAGAVEELTQLGQDVRDDVAEVVARSAHEVERFATAARGGRIIEGRKHSAADGAAF